MQTWYYLVDDGERIGPFSTKEMIDLYKGEKIHSETFVWKEGLNEWVYFRDSPMYTEELAAMETDQPVQQKMIRDHKQDKAKNLPIRALFSEVFKAHAKVSVHDTANLAPRPWVFSRVLLVMVVTCAVLFPINYVLLLPHLSAGVLLLASIAIPLTLFLFFWELNPPKPMRFSDIGQMFFIGIVLGILVYTVSPIGLQQGPAALLFAIVLEMVKLIAIGYYVYRLNPRYILNGVLIGVTIGAAFAIIETLGQALAAFSSGGYGPMLDTVFFQGWSAIGSHTVWGAISSGALIFVKKSDRLRMNHFIHPDFWKFFAVPLILHVAWNVSVLFNQTFFAIVSLSVIAWIVLLRMIQYGLSERGVTYDHHNLR